MFGFGLVLLSGSLVFQSDARQVSSVCCYCSNSVDAKTRYQSQGCCEDTKRATRHFSNRIGPYRYRANNKSCDTCRYTYQHASRRNDVTKYSQYKTRQISYRKRLDLKRQREVMHYPRYENTVSSAVNAVRKSDYILKIGVPGGAVARMNGNKKNLFEDEYAVEIPQGFYKDINGVYRKKGSSLAFRVLSAGKCNSLGFTTCVKGVSNNFKDEQNLGSVRNYKQVNRWNQTVHEDFTYYPSVTESFDATVFGREHSYFIYNAVNPENGEIIRVEVVSDKGEKLNSIQSVFNMFETFRFKI